MIGPIIRELEATSRGLVAVEAVQGPPLPDEIRDLATRLVRLIAERANRYAEQTLYPRAERLTIVGLMVERDKITLHLGEVTGVGREAIPIPAGD